MSEATHEGAETGLPLTKEQVYDEVLEPLLRQVNAVCQTHNIGWLASFNINEGDHPAHRATTTGTTQRTMDSPMRLDPTMWIALGLLSNQVRIANQACLVPITPTPDQVH